ncbi:hypothetical protein H5410_047873 [Solanum commersonii]|uniref:START domain-containing protein n=1 Tax=Solanum commersonii TaxID=4109 RepID=A0A9J5XIM3_SOLCO|nr:hypothetical protein H5410_047873 [Solanum commersonii]
MKEAMKKIMCPKCDGPPIGKEERTRVLKMENQRLREQYERVLKLISSVPGRSFVMVSNLAPSKSTLGYPPRFRQESNTNNNVQAHSININNIPIMSPSRQEHYEFHHDNTQKTIMFEIVVASMNEMVELWKRNDPIWVESSSEGRCSIHRESYERTFPNPNRPYYQSPATQIESSKDSEVVSMTAIELIHNFLDPVKWMNMFPTIVTKARTIEVLDSGTWGGSIQLRFFFIRCCRQFDPTTWIMMDVSYDLFNEIQSGVHSYSWKFPSGCAIQDMGNGQSKVTWVEHVQVYEKNQVHRIFRDLLCDRQTYGAKRWIVTLQRMSERYSFAMGAICPTRHDFKGDNLDFPTSSRLNRGDRISIRTNEEFVQPKGFSATAATSLWFPLSFQDVFNFFKDDKTRCQPCMQKEMLVLQETNIDSMGAFLVYAPIELPTVTSIVNGGDATKVPILPSGIIISPDGHLSSDRDSTANAENGSILTVTFQILISGHNNPTSQKQQMEVVASIHCLLSSIILKIKAALGCSDL